MTASPHRADHEHQIDLDGALDFINTLDLDDGVLIEHFATPRDAAAWLLDHHLIHEDDVEAWTIEDLERTKSVRHALRDVVDGVVLDRRPSPESLRLVNEVLDLEPRPMLELGPAGVQVGHRHVGDCASEALIPVADAIVAELATGRPDRFRICANDQCRWTFYDDSPTGRRRWCDMKTCGNRAKAARHREKVRQSRQDTATNDPPSTNEAA